MRKQIELTTAQANALDRLTTLNGMDCWFYIEDLPNGKYRVRDLEDGAQIMSTRKAVEQVFEGCLEEDFDLLTKEERRVIDDLMEQVI